MRHKTPRPSRGKENGPAPFEGSGRFLLSGGWRTVNGVPAEPTSAALCSVRVELSDVLLWAAGAIRDGDDPAAVLRQLVVRVHAVNAGVAEAVVADIARTWTVPPAT